MLDGSVFMGLSQVLLQSHILINDLEVNGNDPS